jgi:outer membrane murein-binding lipoprotein Lpp
MDELKQPITALSTNVTTLAADVSTIKADQARLHIAVNKVQSEVVGALRPRARARVLLEMPPGPGPHHLPQVAFFQV